MGRPKGMFAPDTRRARWRATHNITGSLNAVIAAVAIYAGLTATSGSAICFLFGLAMLLCGLSDFRSARRGWRMKHHIPARAWRDASRPGVGGEVARKAIKNMLGSYERGELPDYAFDADEKLKDDIAKSRAEQVRDLQEQAKGLGLS